MIMPDRFAENNQVGLEMVQIYRAWDRIETDTETGIKVVDIDVAPLRRHQPLLRVIDREQVAFRFRGLIPSADQETADGEYLAAKMTSTLTFLRALKGVQFGLNEYTIPTAGVVLQPVPTRELDLQRKKVEDIFVSLGPELKDLGFNAVGWQRFLDREHLNKSEIIESFNRARRKFVPIIMDVLGTNIRPVYRTSFVEDDQPWLNWMAGGRIEGFTLKINTHPRNNSSWYRGNTGKLAVHEILGHLFQAYCWKRNIEDRAINPGYGVTTIPGPEQWGCEGLATTLPFLIPELYQAADPYEQFAIELQYLTELVNNNLNLAVNGPEPVGRQELRELVREYLPNVSHRQFNKRIRGMIVNPVWRGYYPAYEDGTRYFRKIADQLRPEARIKLLKDHLYSRPMTPRQIKLAVAELRAA